MYHSRFISGERVTWIGELPLAASIRWFEYLAFGGTASLVLSIGTATAVLATGEWRRNVTLNSTIRACALLCFVTLAAAVGISLDTPILTSRNMIVVLPAIYVIAAELGSRPVSRWGNIAGTTYLVLQVGLIGQPLVDYYTIDVNDQWRDSAALVLGTPGCESGAIHVYGDASNYRFFTGPVRPDLRLVEIAWGGTADLGTEPSTSCPIVLWAVGVAAWDLDVLLVRLGLSRSTSEVVEYHAAFVIFRKQP